MYGQVLKHCWCFVTVLVMDFNYSVYGLLTLGNGINTNIGNGMIALVHIMHLTLSVPGVCKYKSFIDLNNVSGFITLWIMGL